MMMTNIFDFLKRIFLLPKKITISFFLITIFLASSWSLFSPKFFRVHDYTHAARISQMTLAMSEGHFPVRWTKDFGYGYGMPLFEFYAPLPYYVGGLFYWLGLDMILVLKLLFVICSGVTLWGGYKLGEKLFGSSGGIVTAAAITLASYRAVNLFVRGALSEAWAIMALPWILYGIIGVVDGSMGYGVWGMEKNRIKKNWLVLVLSLTTLFLSHNLTSMMFVPMSILFGAIYWGYLLLRKNNFYLDKGRLVWKNILQTLGRLAGGYVMAGALSAFYLGPAYLEKSFTKVEEFVLGGYFDYGLHFLYIRQFFNSEWGFGGSAWGVDDDISFFLGWGQWLGLIVAGVVLLNYVLRWLRKYLNKSGKITSLFNPKFFLSVGISFLLGISLYMSLLKAKFIWDLIPVFAFIQFPWRWLSVAIVFVGLLAGIPTLFIKGKIGRVAYAWLIVAVIVMGNFYYFRPEKYLADSNDYYYTEEKLIRENMSGILEDYIPVQMAEKLVSAEGLVGGKLGISQSDLANIQKNEYSILLDRTHEKLIQTSFTEETLLELNLADFPGWFVEIDGEKISYERGDLGNIVVEVPAGEHLIGVKFRYTMVRLVSDLVSLGALIVLVGMVVGGDKKFKSMY